MRVSNRTSVPAICFLNDVAVRALTKGESKLPAETSASRHVHSRSSALRRVGIILSYQQQQRVEVETKRVKWEAEREVERRVVVMLERHRNKIIDRVVGPSGHSTNRTCNLAKRCKNFEKSTHTR